MTVALADLSLTAGRRSAPVMMPPGTFHPGQSSGLRDPELIEIEGDHESLLTAPEHLADALLEALAMLHACRSARSTADRARA